MPYLAIASTAMNIFGGLSQAAGARKAAKAHNKAAMKWYRQQEEYNVRVWKNNLRQNLIRDIEEQTAQRFQQADIQKQSLQARREYQSWAGESGLEGQSQRLVAGDIRRQEGDAVTMSYMNLQSTLRQLAAEAEGMAIAPVAPPQFQQGPSDLDVLSGVAGSVMGGFNMYNQQTGNTMGQTFREIGNFFRFGGGSDRAMGSL